MTQEQIDLKKAGEYADSLGMPLHLDEYKNTHGTISHRLHSMEDFLAGIKEERKCIGSVHDESQNLKKELEVVTERNNDIIDDIKILLSALDGLSLYQKDWLPKDAQQVRTKYKPLMP